MGNITIKMTDVLFKSESYYINRILSYFKQEGFIAFVRKVIDAIITPFFVYKKVVIYEYSEKNKSILNPNKNILFKELIISDLPALNKIMYQSTKKIKNWFQRGDRCFVAEINGKIANYIWVCFSENYLPSIERKIRLKNGEAYIYNGRTLSPFRRQGIFLFVLNKLCESLSKSGYQRIWASVLSDNILSQKALEKTGFEKSEEIAYLKFFGYRKYNYKRTK